MIRFIKMWLLLRALQEDVRYNSESRNNKNLKEDLAYGEIFGVGILHFLSLISFFGLVVYFLPLWIRIQVKWYKLWDKKLSIDVSNPKMQELQSLVTKAQSMEFIVRDKGLISITAKGDDFNGWIYGANKLLAEYPYAWGAVAAIASVPILKDIMKFVWELYIK